VWAYILLFVLLGPEMTQEEREEHAQEAKEFEEIRLSGASLADIGAQRVRTKESKAEHIERVETHEEPMDEKKEVELV
jgi:MFS transporter, SHS family, lactate transporter